jgi:lambda repressor-like predicted transcriptional regulator
MSPEIHSPSSRLVRTTDDLLRASALQAIVAALGECDSELRDEALQLLRQLSSGKLDEYEREATMSLLAEILFNDGGFPADEATEQEALGVVRNMQAEEGQFADRLRQVMADRGITQEQLAKAIGVGQSAISMMLQRKCRPQKRTVRRLAAALGVVPEALWPGLESASGSQSPEG